MQDELSPHQLEFYSTQLMPCPYLAGRNERKLLTELAPEADPQQVYNALARHGFRRSHDWAYRPACPECNACVPVRLVVDQFNPSRSMRRCINRHVGWHAIVRPPVATQEQFALFSSYVRGRHMDGEMSTMNFEQYRDMLEETTVDTQLIEFRISQRLVAGIMVDRVRDGLSAVYSFFDPELSAAGPGTFMVLWLAEHTRTAGLRNLYLGYWVKGCRKMDYKVRFRPLEALTSGGWHTFDPPTWRPPKA